MAYKGELADPVERRENGVSQKSYADALVEDGPNGKSLRDSYHFTSAEESEADAEAEQIDESIVKETPPPTKHMRNGSGTRPLGEIIDEAESASPSPASSTRAQSPTLRHPKGRLEEKSSRDSYAEALKHGVNGSHPNSDGTRTPEAFDGVGEDDTPRSPTGKRTSHRRTPSSKLNGTNMKDELQRLVSPEHNFIQPAVEPLEPDSKTGDLIYENVYNKSGENLASLKPGDGYYLSLAQRGDESSGNGRGKRQRTNSELVSGRQAGAGWGRSAIRWAPMNVPLQRRLQTLLVLLHTLSIAGGLAIFFLLCTIPLLWPILVPYLLYVLMSRAAIDGKLSHRSEWFRNSKIWSLFGSYFPARLHRSQQLEPTRKYIFGYHPHGIISHGAFAAFATEALGFSQLFPGITNSLLTLDANFRVPLYRDYALRMGLASVSRESCENILSKGGPNGEGMGRAITIVIGGARESLDAKPKTLKLVLKRRKGFVKLAIRTGADLVPVLAFGENDLYDQLDTNQHPYVHKGQMLIKKLMGFTVPLFHARGEIRQ